MILQILKKICDLVGPKFKFMCKLIRLEAQEGVEWIMIYKYTVNIYFDKRFHQQTLTNTKYVNCMLISILCQKEMRLTSSSRLRFSRMIVFYIVLNMISVLKH